MDDVVYETVKRAMKYRTWNQDRYPAAISAVRSRWSRSKCSRPSWRCATASLVLSLCSAKGPPIGSFPSIVRHAWRRRVRTM